MRGVNSVKAQGSQCGGIATRVDPPAADVMLVELELVGEDVREVVPEVVVVLGRAEDPLFFERGGVGFGILKIGLGLID